MTRTLVTSTMLLAGALLASACGNSENDFERKNATTSGGPEVPGDPTQPGTCAVGVAHADFAGYDFVADRVEGAIGADRRRVKPASALGTDFTRIFGKAPTKIGSAAAAFGSQPARWYAEPAGGAISSYTTYSLAFSACYDSMTDAKYQAAPTVDTAKAECAALQRRLWSRTGTPEEVAACTKLAVEDLSATEPLAIRRWAHACAAVASSTGFTTY